MSRELAITPLAARLHRYGAVAVQVSMRRGFLYHLGVSKVAHNKLSSLNNSSGFKWNEEEEVLLCTSPHALVQAAGYLKHVYGANGARILFRGQTKLWKPCRPSIFRSSKQAKQGFQSRQTEAIKAYIQEARKEKAFLKGEKFPYDEAHEPLLQHYGIRTHWLDVVDNIWIALWFSVFDCIVDKKKPKFWHFDESSEEYGYILLVSPGQKERPIEGKPGIFETDTAQLIDLRVAVPSLYTRPHAQHGLLFRKKSYPPMKIDLDEFIVGRIKVNRLQAKDWLGPGLLHTPRVVFPPPHYDIGYKYLVEHAPPPPSSLGAIAMVFP